MGVLWLQCMFTWLMFIHCKESGNALNLEPDIDDSTHASNMENTSQVVSNLSLFTNTAGFQVTVPQSRTVEEHSSFTIFFILLVLALCILVTHVLIVTRFRYLPESVAVMIVGGIIGGLVKVLSMVHLVDLNSEEAFPPTVFFVIILPPIIFESGYNLNKGNFFANFGTIILFAVFGTIISACIIAGGLYFLGLIDLVYKLSFVESFAFGSMVSASDPVATLAVFHALDVDPVLYMLVFGESVLNDAVSIVLTSTVLGLASPSSASLTSSQAFLRGLMNFCITFAASSAIGVVFAVVSAIVLKFVDLRKTPSLETALMFIFSYLPYGLAEGLGLSGITAVLFAGILMSHYTHCNLSPVTQITVQQTFRAVAFAAETCVYAYLGMSIFSMYHHVEVAFVLWAIALCLIARAVNTFPLSFIANRWRSHQLTWKTQVVIWFSGLRGAIAFALSLNIDIEKEKRQVLVTTTLIIVIFTTLVLGGGTLPLMTLLNRKKAQHRKHEFNLSKTQEMGKVVETDPLSSSERTEEGKSLKRSRVSRFVAWDTKYFLPWLTRSYSAKDLKEGQDQITNLSNKWYNLISQRSATEEDADDNDDDDDEQDNSLFDQSDMKQSLLKHSERNSINNNDVI